jgi:lipopolysaccharide transport system ATP-binding protein
MVNGIIADWVQQAALLTVEPGDFYGTGRLPPATHGGFLVPQQWKIQSNHTNSTVYSPALAYPSPL